MTVHLMTLAIRYESIKTVTVPHAKQAGQMDGTTILDVMANHSMLTSRAESSAQKKNAPEEVEQNIANGARAAENIRCGQTISEGGMGGKTINVTGSANQGIVCLLPV